MGRQPRQPRKAPPKKQPSKLEQLRRRRDLLHDAWEAADRAQDAIDQASMPPETRDRLTPNHCPACGQPLTMDVHQGALTLGDVDDPDGCAVLRNPSWSGTCPACGWAGEVTSYLHIEGGTP